MMQLFAIIIKQDGGLSEREKSYVHRFLVQQIGIESAQKYFDLFLVTATASQDNNLDNKKHLTSVLDSVKILKIGKKISKTLNQQQKVVVLIRAIELINTEYNLTDQRVEIIKTIADVFRISRAEYESMLTFATGQLTEGTQHAHILVISQYFDTTGEAHATAKAPAGATMNKPLYVLRVPSVELYFLKYTGDLEIQLNGHPLHAETIYILANGSSIRLPVGQPFYYSDIVARFHSDRSTERISLTARHISYSFSQHVKGLQDISFTAEQGNLVGIMGASGSGKTTLLNVLSGIYTPTSGELFINNTDLFREPEKLRGIMGYVPQDDLLVEELTVFQNLWFNAKFCFRDLPDENIREKVDNMLDQLGLLGKKDLKVGSVMNKTISGGQRKRLNIALELIREPAILFLDEPTSGLSSRDSENVMDLLRQLAIRGKLVFNVIHQPSSELYKMFDQVIVLDEGGQMVYYGNPVEAVVHFRKIDQQVNYGIGECPVCGNTNPEQIFNIIEARQVDEFGNYTSQRKISPEKWRGYFETTRNTGARPLPKDPPSSNLKVPSWPGQFLNYLKRDFRSRISNRQYIVLVLTVSPLLAIILSYITRYIADPGSRSYIFRDNENIPIYIFMSIIVALFLGLIMSAEEIFRDRKILKREKFLHLSRSAYLSSKIINIFLMSAFQALLFILIANNVLGIRYMTFFYWLALFSVAACANLIGLIISSAFNSAVTIYILVPLVMIPMMVLSGAMFSFEKLNRSITSVNKVPLVAEVMPTRWAYEALMVKQFRDNPFQENFFALDREISRTNFRSAYYIPALEERVAALSDAVQETGSISGHDDALMVLKNEILREQDTLGTAVFNETDFSPEKFGQETVTAITQFLSDLNDYYLRKFAAASRVKQNMLTQVMQQDRSLYYSMLNKYHNESIAEHVKKIYEKNKIIASGGRLYQQSDPVFLLPETVRSHFYAPSKYFFGTWVDTYWFNMAMIWMLSVLFYLVLYFDLLRRLVDMPVFRKKSYI